ncbi:Tuberous sclerosis 2-like protein [Malassezia yamatoensis]|uniref:Tuberous sclerosis 2-like protein n=1 Tax=Malassezia yamatoensis TaxID=253288 RepID=A0AAJ5YVN0_9BASI|nr:Tuberous sclerosis 2-like protein [Malassezia yamatoensis]
MNEGNITGKDMIPATSLKELQEAMDRLNDKENMATTEVLSTMRVIIEALRVAVDTKDRLLRIDSASLLVTSLIRQSCQVLRSDAAMEVRLSASELLAVTLRYADASSQQLQPTASESGMRLPNQVLSSLDRALLFKLVVSLRDESDWDRRTLLYYPEKALRTLSCQLTALQALSKDGKDILAFRTILHTLTLWIEPVWGCMLTLRPRSLKGTAQSLSEDCTYSILNLMTSIIKFQASRIAAWQLDQALQCVSGLLLDPKLLHDVGISGQELVTKLGDQLGTGMSLTTDSTTAPDPLLQGYSHFDLESLSPYFSTPQPKPVDQKPDHKSGQRVGRRISEQDYDHHLVGDAMMPDLLDTDIQAVIKVLDAAVCFAFLPTRSIARVVYGMCRIPGLAAVRSPHGFMLEKMQIHTKGIQGEVWSVLGNLLRSHCAYSVLRVLCMLFWETEEPSHASKQQEDQQNGSQAGFNEEQSTLALYMREPSIVVGALLFLHAALLWGVEDQVTQTHSTGSSMHGDQGALAFLSLPAIAALVQGAVKKNMPILDLATVLFLDDCLPERRLEVDVTVDPSLKRRPRHVRNALHTVQRSEHDVFPDSELLHDLEVLAQRHMDVWQAAQTNGAPSTSYANVSRMVLHVLVELISGIPNSSTSQDDSQQTSARNANATTTKPASNIAAYDRPIAAMGTNASLFWSLAPLLPDTILAEMVSQSRRNHIYVPSSSHWIENTLALIETFFPSMPTRPTTGLVNAPHATYEVIQLVCHMYEAVQDMPTFRNEMIESVVGKLLDQAMRSASLHAESEAMLRKMLRHAATTSALDASIAHGTPFFQLLRVLKQTIENAESANASSERRQVRAQHSRQQSLGPSNAKSAAETQNGIQRAIRSIQDMVHIFHQLSFAQPDATETLPIDSESHLEVYRHAQACGLAIFHDLAQYVQCNEPLHLTREASGGSAPFSVYIPTEVRLVILQWFMRMRADRHHRIFFVHDVGGNVQFLAQLLHRVQQDDDQKRGREGRTSAAQAFSTNPSPATESRAESRGRSPMPRGNLSQERGRSQRRRDGSAGGMDSRGSTREPMLWSVPERICIEMPDEDWPSMLWRVSHDQHHRCDTHQHDEASESGDAKEASQAGNGMMMLPMAEYLGMIMGLLQSEADWEIVSYILTHLPSQLLNRHLFCQIKTREQVSLLNDLLCSTLVQQKPLPSVMLPDWIKRTDMYAVVYATLTVLISYRRCFSRVQQDAVLEALVAGLTMSQSTAQPCVRALVVACYELPKSFTRMVPTLLMKLSTIMSSMAASVHILELLIEISGLPAMYANFTELDYKRVFGIALQYIQYHHSSVASSREAIRSSPSQFSLSQYVMMLAYQNIAQWFLTLRLNERAKYVPHITRGLMLANEGRAKLTDQTFVCLDFLARFTYSNAQTKPRRSLIRFLVTHARPSGFSTSHIAAAQREQGESQSWLLGQTVVTLTSLKRKGWGEIVVRRASGVTSMVLKLENEPSATLLDEERMAEALPTTLARTHRASALALPARKAPSPLTHPNFYQDKHSLERKQFREALQPVPLQESHPVGTDADGQIQSRDSAGESAESQAKQAPEDSQATADASIKSPSRPSQNLQSEQEAIHSGSEPNAGDSVSAESGALAWRSGTSASTNANTNATPPRRRDTDRLPAYIALQLSAYPDMNVKDAPLRLPSDAVTDRFLRAIDLTPVYDFHKIGVVYVAYGQHTEQEILGNTYGSSAYIRFLSRLGDLIALRNQEEVYTGGLDRQQDEHGKYAYIWKDNIKQIVFHTATLMPNRANDPTHAAKKALIGNDWVHIVFNEGNHPYQFGTIASQFNFCNIVISPHTVLKNGVEAYEVDDEMFFFVELQRRPGLPDFSAVGRGQLVSFAALPRFVCNLAMYCDLMSQIYLDTGESMVPYTSRKLTTLSDWVTRLHHIERYRAQVEARRTDSSSEKAESVDDRDYTPLLND